MRASLVPAYVIHRRAFSETSLILELFTRDYGRVGLLAKGARRPKSRWAGNLEPFQLVQVSWTGRGELPTLTGVDLSPSRIRLEGRKIVSGLYLNELIMRLTARHDAHPELFEHYGIAVGELWAADHEEAALRVFEKRLLDAIGYGLLTHQEADTGEAIIASAQYHYIREFGPSRQSQAGCLVSGGVLLALEAEQLSSADQLQEAKRLMRFLLAPHLGEKPLYTRALYQPPVNSRLR